MALSSSKPISAHIPGDMDCRCRKPATGMIEQCLTNYDVDIATSYVIGDRDSDVNLAHSIGATSITVRDFIGTAQATFYAPTLVEAVEYIKGNSQK